MCGRVLPPGRGFQARRCLVPGTCAGCQCPRLMPTPPPQKRGEDLAVPVPIGRQTCRRPPCSTWVNRVLHPLLPRSLVPEGSAAVV